MKEVSFVCTVHTVDAEDNESVTPHHYIPAAHGMKKCPFLAEVTPLVKEAGKEDIIESTANSESGTLSYMLYCSPCMMYANGDCCS